MLCYKSRHKKLREWQLLDEIQHWEQKFESVFQNYSLSRISKVHRTISWHCLQAVTPLIRILWNTGKNITQNGEVANELLQSVVVFDALVRQLALFEERVQTTRR